MEHLSKQQIVLLTLLVSFVTALATGVVTVSLMNQAPESVGQTISRVIEKTIEAAAPQSASVGSLPVFEDQIANAVEKVASSTVQIKSKDNGDIVGMGLIVSKEGVIVTDKSVVAQAREYLAVFHNGKQVPITIIQSQINGDIVFLAPFPPDTSLNKLITPIVFSIIPKLGQTILSISGTSTPVLDQGIVTEITYEDKIVDPSTISNIPPAIVHSSIPVSKIMPGSPIFTVNGEVVGINLSSINSGNEMNFYSMNSLKDVIPVIRK